jgi:hypothetical protein
VAAKTNFRRLRAVLVCAAAVATRPARAEMPTQRDVGVEAPAPERARWSPSNPFAPGVWPTTLPWHNSFFYLENSTTTQTVGVGNAYLTRDPYYELTLGLRPRLYLTETDIYEVVLLADVGVTSERTNSDSTTKQGEWSATDFELSSAFAAELRSSKDEATDLDVRLPRLIFPTSRISYDSGKILGLGARALLAEDILLAGRESAYWPNVLIGVRAEYGYQFTRARVPTNAGLERIRIDPDGRSVVSDQLGGATFAAQSAVFGALVSAYVHQSVAWTTSVDVRPAWHYPVQQDVQICGVVLTGCTTATGVANPQTRSTLTSFSSDVLMQLSDVVGLSVGYSNVTAQLGPDGRRRSVFYSPDARFYAQLTIGLDQLYGAVASRGSTRSRASRDLSLF